MDASEVGRLLKVAQPWLDRYNETVPAANGGTKTAPVEADLRPSLEQLEKLLKQTHLFTSFDMKVQELETATAELNARVANIKHWIRDVDTSLGSFWTHDPAESPTSLLQTIHSPSPTDHSEARPFEEKLCEAPERLRVPSR